MGWGHHTKGSHAAAGLSLARFCYLLSALFSVLLHGHMQHARSWAQFVELLMTGTQVMHTPGYSVDSRYAIPVLVMMLRCMRAQVVETLTQEPGSQHDACEPL